MLKTRLFTTSGAVLFASCASALTLEPVATHTTGVFDEGAAEIVAHDPTTHTLFVVNGADNTVDLLAIRTAGDAVSLEKTGTLDVSEHGAPNSVALHGDYVAIAVGAENPQDPGSLVLFRTDGSLVGTAEVGALPDMVTFTPDCTHAVLANEGEPSADFKTDPEGSVSIVSIPGLEVRNVAFTEADTSGIGSDLHTPAPEGTTAGQNIEPEYVAITPDGTTAFVSLQEANAIAVIDVPGAKLIRLFSAGTQDYSQHAIDVSDKDDSINTKPWPVMGLRQPDAIAAFEADGAIYVATANEGDTRDYDGYSEEARVADLKLDPAAFPNAQDLQQDEALGRLKVTKARGDTDGDGDHDALFAFGGRSFSIFDRDGKLVFDSGSEMEAKLAELRPDIFNSEYGTAATVDDRSDDKGIEPEAIAIGEVGEKRYAFIGLERAGGVMVYDITDPAHSSFVTYATAGKAEGDPEAGTAGDVAPEGVIFIPAEESPTGNPMLAIANEVSGSTTLFVVRP